MKLKTIIDEDFTNFSKCSMFICTHTCNFKCGKENCQNLEIFDMNTLDIENSKVIERYLSNKLTSVCVIAGLEPFDSFEELKSFVEDFRDVTEDFIILYSGYNKIEILKEIETLKQYPNIIVKYGRFVPNQESHYDEILGVNLASPNQYAERIS